MITGWPHGVDSLSAMIRGMVSRLAPGGAGTTILTVRLG